MKHFLLFVFALSIFQCSFSQTTEPRNNSLHFTAGFTYPILYGLRIRQDQLTGNGYFSRSDHSFHNEVNYTLGLRWISASKGTVHLESGFYLSQYSAFAKRDIVFHGYSQSETRFETEVMRYKFIYAEAPLLFHISVDDEDLFNINLGITPTAILLNNSRWSYQTTYQGEQYNSQTGTWYYDTIVTHHESKLITKGMNVAFMMSFGCPVVPIGKNWITANFGIQTYLRSSTTYYYNGEDVLRFSHIGYFLRFCYSLSSMSGISKDNLKLSPRENRFTF